MGRGLNRIACTRFEHHSIPRQKYVGNVGKRYRSKPEIKTVEKNYRFKVSLDIITFFKCIVYILIIVMLILCIIESVSIDITY